MCRMTSQKIKALFVNTFYKANNNHNIDMNFKLKIKMR